MNEFGDPVNGVGRWFSNERFNQKLLIIIFSIVMGHDEDVAISRITSLDWNGFKSSTNDERLQTFEKKNLKKIVKTST